MGAPTTSPGLSWPDHDTGPYPPPQYKGKRTATDGTRKPLAWWDRIKLLLLFLVAWTILFFSLKAQFDPRISWADSINQAVRSYWWILALAGIELIRQIHYFVCERSARYNRFCERRYAGFNRRVGRMNDWNRYRISRVLKVLFVLVIADLILAALFHLNPWTAAFTLPLMAIRALPTILQYGLFISLGLFQIVALYWFLSKGGVDVYFPDDVKTRFSDVWGQDHVLNRIKENMVFLEDPESIEDRGGYVPAGILLWGPPGTGKTLMAEAVAGETGKPFVFVDPGAFIQMFMGVGILKVKSLYRKLRRLAVRYGGVIVFFDEADSLGNRGTMGPQGPWGGTATPAPWSAPSCNGPAYLSEDGVAILYRSSVRCTPAEDDGRRVNRFFFGMGGGMGTLQALLTEMSGLKKPRGFFNRRVRRALGMRPKPPPKYRILHMFATNMPQALDEAMLRPGRIDRIYKVGYPSKPGRIRTYQGYFDKVSNQIGPEEIEKLAIMTPYATGATIKDLVNESLICAIRDGRDTISWADVMRAKQLKDLGPPEDVEYIERERHAVAVHEACHAVTAYRARQHMAIDIATIEKGGTYLGMVASIKPEDQFTSWRTEYEADIMVSLASLAGERMFFDGDSSSGVSGDLEGATRVAVAMEGYWGMGSTVASHGVTHQVGIGGGGRPGDGKDEQELLKGGLGERIEGKLGDLLKQTEQLLTEHRHEVLALAYALETTKTLAGEDVVAIIEGQQGPLVDGRPYHAPAFLRSLEAYHESAVAAHRGHAKLSLALPALPPAVDEGNGHHEGPAAASTGVGQVASGESPAETGDGRPPLADGHIPPAPPAPAQAGNGEVKAESEEPAEERDVPEQEVES